VIWSLVIAELAFPGGIVGFLSTPRLCKLEGLLHREMAGYAGPETWIWLVFGLMTSWMGGIVAYTVVNKD
jgi:hypothetical protein